MNNYFRLLAICLIFTGVLCCSSKDNATEEMQDAPFLTVSQQQMEIGADGGTIYVTVSSNRNVTVLSSKPWCEALILENATSGNLKVTIGQNDGADRVVGVLLSAEGCPTVELTITQRAVVTNPGGEGGNDTEQLRFRVAQYNIRVSTSADDASGNGWNIRKTPLSQLIIRHDFDIVGTQEGNTSQLTDLKALLPGYDYVAAPYGGSSGTSHNCAIFYKKNMFEVLTTGTFWFSETPDVPSIGWDATDRRICHWAKLKEKTSGKEFYFFDVHFYWQYTTAKQNSGPLMAQKIREIAGGAPAISTGDYNSGPTTSQILIMLTVMSDAHDITLTPRIGPEGTGFAGGVFQGIPGSRIDYIFVSSHFSVLDYAVLTDSYNDGRYPSDHLPVTSMVSIKRD